MVLLLVGMACVVLNTRGHPKFFVFEFFSEFGIRHLDSVPLAVRHLVEFRSSTVDSTPAIDRRQPSTVASHR